MILSLGIMPHKQNANYFVRFFKSFEFLGQFLRHNLIYQRQSAKKNLSAIFRHSKNLTCQKCKEKESEVAQSCLTLCYPMDCSSPGSSVHGILQARILEGLAFPLEAIFLTQGSNLHLLQSLHWQVNPLPADPCI